jgi:hypothetical protein
MKLLVLHVF